MIKLGNDNIGNIMLGNTQVIKIYVGDVLIWSYGVN
jgi:hypothetical protein